MAALITGIVFILLALFAVVPGLTIGLGWWTEFIIFLKGALPVLAIFIGLIAVLIGVADIKDKVNDRKNGEEVKEE
jgi:hypothetical protein